VRNIRTRVRALNRCKQKYPVVAEVVREIGWPKLWDTCLSLGEAHTMGLRKLGMALAHHGKGGHPCPCCDTVNLERGGVLQHIVHDHWKALHLNCCSQGEILDRLRSMNLSFLPKFRNLYNFHL